MPRKKMFGIFGEGGGIGEELMGGQPNSSKPSGYTLVKSKGREIIVTEDGGKTQERWVKSNGYSGYTLHYNGNQYEFVDSFAGGGGVDSDELPYPYQMQWEKLLSDYGTKNVMSMFPSGANGYYTSRTKGNYSDDAIRQSLNYSKPSGIDDLIKG
jgi:hypothetical protein